MPAIFKDLYSAELSEEVQGMRKELSRRSSLFTLAKQAEKSHQKRTAIRLYMINGFLLTIGRYL